MKEMNAIQVQKIKLTPTSESAVVGFKIIMPNSAAEAGYLEVKFAVDKSGQEEIRYIGREETGVTEGKEIYFDYALTDGETYKDAVAPEAIYYVTITE